MIELFSLVFLIFLFPVFTEQIPDYDNPYAPIFTDKPVYTWTDKVQMTILAPSWNTDRYLIDSIGDTEDHSIEVDRARIVWSAKPVKELYNQYNSAFGLGIQLAGL